MTPADPSAYAEGVIPMVMKTNRFHSQTQSAATTPAESAEEEAI